MHVEMTRTEWLVNKWESRRDVQNIMGKYSNYLLIRKEKDIFEEFWSKRDDISFGVNEGYYVGRDAVSAYYRCLDEYNILIGKTMKEALPDQLASLSAEELYGIGLQDNKPICNQIIEIADDLQTAKGLWHSQGKYDALTEMGPMSYWTWGWFAGDFIFEDGAWRIWHLIYVEDIHWPCGFQWDEDLPEYDIEPVFAEASKFQFVEPNVKETLREYYSKLRPYTGAPRIPEPYVTFSDTFSYGKEVY